jgi:hypothetical protein
LTSFGAASKRYFWGEASAFAEAGDRGVVGRAGVPGREERGVIGEGRVETVAVDIDEEGRGSDVIEAFDEYGLDWEDDSLIGTISLGKEKGRVRQILRGSHSL